MTKIRYINRRTLLRVGLAATLSPIPIVQKVFASKEPGLMPGSIPDRQSQPNPEVKIGVTPAQTQGPFYPIKDQTDRDTDLTIINGHKQSAKGEIIDVRGQVLDNQLRPLANTIVEIWQANTWGRYSHARDPNTAPLDPNFQGWGQTISDSGGNYRFKTIKPGAYPASADWMRPPHIHFKVYKPGYALLITQMYFADEKLNGKDHILNRIPLNERERVIATIATETPTTKPIVKSYHFNIVIQATSFAKLTRF